MNRFVSIIILVLTRSCGVRVVLDGLPRAYQLWKVIVVDHDSSDRTAQVVRNYTRKDPGDFR